MARGPGQTNILHRLLRTALAVLAASVAFNTSAADSELTLRVVGYAEGTAFTARHTALQDAREKAIVEVLKSKVADGDLRPYRAIVRKADVYISRLAELHLDTEAGVTRVEVDAYINIRALENDLAAMVKPRLATPPTVTCLIASQDENGILTIDGGTLAEKTMVEGLQALELTARAHGDTEVRFETAHLHDALLGDLDRASSYARETLSDAVVLGIVTVERDGASDTRGTAKTRATLNARVFRGSDGDLLEVFARSAAITGNDPDECREEAVRDTATKMLGDITVATVLSVLSTQKRDEVLITLMNPGNRSRIELFTGLLGQDPMVFAIEESYSSERSARIRIGYEGPMSHLVDLISDKLYEGWTVEVQEVIGREMKLVMVPGDGSGEN